MNHFVVIVTGSTKGIGLSTAEKLIEAGASVVIHGRDERKLNEILEKYDSVRHRVAGVLGDIRNPETGMNIVRTAVEKFGTVHTLINNAGAVKDGLLYKMSNEQFTDIIDIHVNGNFYCTKPFVQFLKRNKQHGHIINITSESGLLGNIGQVNYSAAKAAVVGMTYTLAKELKRDGIIVNAIAPLALTDMTRPFVEKAKQKAMETGEPLDPMWDIGSAEDVAQFIVSLIKRGDMNQSGKIFGVNGKEITYWHPPKKVPFSE